MTHSEKIAYYNSFEYTQKQILNIEQELFEKYGTKNPVMTPENEVLLRDLYALSMKANKIAGIKIF